MLRRWALGLLCSAGMTACVRVPAPGSEQNAAADASLVPQLVMDGGPTRPEAGPPYTGPECAPAAAATPMGSADADAGTAPNAMSADAMQTGATVSGSEVAQVRPARSAGDVVITEIMVDPAAVSDTAGEWFELHNPSASDALDLGGCGIDSGEASLHAIAAPFVLMPGAYAVIARSADAGFVPDLIASLSLTNSADVLGIVCGGTTIDRVSYGPGFPLAAGKSMSLDPGAGAQDNDFGAAWCLAQSSFGSDFGTPGAPNPPCDDAADAGAG